MSLTRQQVISLPTYQDVLSAVSRGDANALDVTAWEMAHPGGQAGNNTNLWRTPSGQIVATTGWARNTVDYNIRTYNWVPAGGGGGGGGGGAPSPAWGPEAEWLNRIGQGQPGYRDPSQKYLANLYDPLRATFGLEQKFSRLLGRGAPEAWENYIPTVATGGYSAITGRAKQLLDKLLGMSGVEREINSLSAQPTYDPATGLAETSEGEMTPADLESLVGLGGASRFGNLGARWAERRLP